jgi:hypothetical protein
MISRMARKKNKASKAVVPEVSFSLPTQTKRAIIVVVFAIIGIFLSLAAFDGAGIIGADAYNLFSFLRSYGGGPPDISWGSTMPRRLTSLSATAAALALETSKATQTSSSARLPTLASWLSSMKSQSARRSPATLSSPPKACGSKNCLAPNQP